MKKYIILLYSLLLLSVALQAQQYAVGGKVSNGKENLAGVSVYEKDLPTNGTFTDEQGRFRLTLKGKGRILIFSIVNYVNQEVNVAGKSEVDVVMSNDTKGLNEVIVVGYGTQKKITTTGAVSTISGDAIRQTPSASLQNTLIGRVPGIVTQQRSGRPGSDGADIKIRGLSTSNGSGAPLVVVDDLEYTGDISEIDPDQIETFTVLKDAATTAVYGIKGANGVIVITTRRGKAGRPSLSFRSELGLQKPIYLPKYLDSYNAALLVNQAQENDGNPLKYTQEDLDLFKNGTDPYGHPNVNWTETLLRHTTTQTRNNINVQGGTDKAKYFLTGGYLWQNGLIKDFAASSDMNSNIYYKRYNFRSNLDIKATSTLTLNLDLAGVFSERNNSNIGGRNARNNIFFELSDYNQLPPFAYSIYNPNGTYGINSSYAASNNNIVGRLALNGYNRSFDNDLTANFKATQKLDFITQGLSVRGVAGYNGHYRFWRSLTRTNFPSYSYNAKTGEYTIFNSNYYRTDLPSLGYYSDDPNSFKRLNWQASLNYDRNFGGNHVYGLALYNSQSDITGVNVPIGFKGYTFRLGYDYKQRYLLEFNAGYNGSSKFEATKRYAWFPAVSAGWNIAEEEFFKKSLPFIDLFKLRGSFGLTGSDYVDPSRFQYVYIQNYNRNSSGYSIGEVSQNVFGITEGTLGNNSTWEKERQTDIGVDVNMFKGALRIVADYFRRYRYDILVSRQSVPNLIGVGLPPSNISRIQNNGYEVQVTYTNHIKEFNYNISGNVSFAKNKVLFQDEPTQPYPWLATTGHPLGSILGFNYQGFYTQQEIDDPKVPRPLASVGATRAGDLKYADRDGDGVITTNDRSVLAYPNLPSTIMGLTVGFSYKSFSFTATAQSALKFALRAQAEAVKPFVNNLREIHTQAWTPTNNVNPAFPRLTAGSNINDPLAYPSDFWFRRSDYLRIKTAEIGYAFPKKWMQKLKLSGGRIYANGYNLFTWSLKAKNIYDIDPETPSGTDGADFYPQTKVFNFGLQLNL